jgi:3-deoxy-D-manno-octulosonic-acid transferase
MGFVMYNILLIVTAPIILVVLLVKKRCRPGFLSRIGCRLPNLPLNDSTIWIHAVSLGESVAVVPLVRSLHQRFPHFSFVISTVTETGKEVVERQLNGIASHCYFPLDYPWTVQRYLDKLNPTIFIVVETELWPNLLRCLFQHHVPTVLVNGRISSQSFTRYKLVRSFCKQVLSMITLFLMQSSRDGDRVCELGADPSHVVCTGNMKFDVEPNKMIAVDQDFPSESIGLHPGEVLIVAGSTHSEDEDQLILAYRVLMKSYPHCILLIAPRHIERADEVERKITECGLGVVRRSRLVENRVAQNMFGHRIILLDTRGELSQVYQHGRIAFVGGSLSPIGGHNLLEPAMWGKPVVFGPYTDHCQEIAHLLLEGNGGIRVSNVEELIRVFRTAVEDETWAKKLGEANRQIIVKNQGVVSRNVMKICSLMEDAKFSKGFFPGGESYIRSPGKETMR